MRLTLRTLLAYLDDILEPADAAEMGKKIEESEFATSLLHRTRDVTRRLRLGAPKLHGRGMGLDPNTVAEYLDHMLPSERVPDFEKVCLESDVHLAEVASAHQILALVLGEPAEFDARSRQRMYALVTAPPAAPSEDGHAPAVSSKSSEKPSRSRKRKKRKQPKVPAYLREPSETAGSRRWLIAAAALLLVAAGAALAVRFGAPDTWRRLTGEQVAANVPPAEPADDLPAETSSAAGAGDSDGKPSEKGSTAADEEASDSAPPPEPDKDSAEMPAEESASSERPSAPAEASDDEPPVAPMPGDKPAKQPGGKAKSAPRGEVMGRLISEHDVLLRWSPEDEDWYRLPARESVFSSEALLALPTYQPNIALGAGVTVQLLGGAWIELDAPDAQGAPGINVLEGRVLLMTVAKPDVQLRVKAGDYNGVVAFGRDDATLAIEVARELPDGVAPEEARVAAQVDLYLAAGEVQWASPGSGAQKLKAPEHRMLHADASASQPGELPAWIKSIELAPIERRASLTVDELFPTDRPAADVLKELAEDRKAEVSLLAMKSLALVGEFDLFVDKLNTPSQKHAWTPEIESLRAALARDPKVAAQIREAFENRRGEMQGAELYRLLWGYSAEQLKAGADKQLVEYLADDNLDVRVLSFWNLHHLTGFLSGYRPADSEIKRNKGVAAWRQKLSSGQIVPMPSANER
jgi:hypothetical protein